MSIIKNLGLSAILASTAIAQTPNVQIFQAKEYNTKITNNLDKITIELSKGKLAGTSNIPIDNAKRYLNRYKDDILENGEATQYVVSYKNNTFGIFDGSECLSYVKFTTKDPLVQIVKYLQQ